MCWPSCPSPPQPASAWVPSTAVQLSPDSRETMQGPPSPAGKTDTFWRSREIKWGHVILSRDLLSQQVRAGLKEKPAALYVILIFPSPHCGSSHFQQY